MKRSFRPTAVLCLAALLSLLGKPNGAAAQDGQGKYVADAAIRLTKLMDTANKEGYSLQNNVFSIGGGWLKQSEETWVPLYTVQLEAGKAYRFIAAGDGDARDVDLEVRDANDKSVARDDKTDSQAVVDFTPASSGRYTVRIRLFDSMNHLPCMCVAVVMTKTTKKD